MTQMGGYSCRLCQRSLSLSLSTFWPAQNISTIVNFQDLTSNILNDHLTTGLEWKKQTTVWQAYESHCCLRSPNLPLLPHFSQAGGEPHSQAYRYQFSFKDTRGTGYTFSALPGHRCMPQNFLNSCAFLPPHKSILPEMRNVAPCCGPTLSTGAEDQGQKSQSPWLFALSSPKAGPAGWAMHIPFSPRPFCLCPFAKGLQSFRHFPQTKPRLPSPAEAGSPVLRPKRQLVQPSRSPCCPQARRMRGAYTWTRTRYLGPP